MVWAVDVNERALDLTARNAATLGLAAVRAVRPEAVPASIHFTGVWSNPPIRIGKEPLHQLLSTWLPRLEPDGTAWMVVHRHLGGDSLAAWLRAEGWAVNRAASKRGYRILEVGRGVKQLGPTDLKRLHREWNRRSPGRLALLLDGLQSPYNMGAIVRTAAAYRVEHLYLGGGSISPANPEGRKVVDGHRAVPVVVHVGAQLRRSRRRS